MKDKNGIEKACINCRYYEVCASDEVCEKYTITVQAYIARIAELQKELNIVQESERAEAQEADRLRGEVKELEKKLTETVKLLGERSRECGKLQALLEVKNRSDISTQSTDAADVSKNGEKSTESEK